MITPATTLPSIKTDDIITVIWHPGMKEFKEEQRVSILNAKRKLKHHLQEFDMTIGKLNILGGKAVNKNYYVSGGCIGSLLRGEVPKDYDVYFRDANVAKCVIDLYTSDSFKNEVAIVEEKYRDTLVTIGDDKTLCITENAMSLKNRIQIITKHYGEPDDVRKTFDFVHCLPYYDSLNDSLYISMEQYELNDSKKLKVNNQSNLTPWREEKFKDRGWTWL